MTTFAALFPAFQEASTPLTDTENWVINSFFGVVAVVMVLAALKLVTTSNVVHASLYLLIVLAGVAVQYIILGAEFAAATQVMVYIGAILVLLIFGVMLTRAKLGADDDLNYENRWMGGFVGVLLAALLTYALWDQFDNVTMGDDIAVQRTSEVADSIFSTYIVPFEAISVLLLAALIGAVVVARRD